MSGIKRSICEFYNRNTFITEILNVTTHPHYPATKLFGVKEQKERQRGEERGLGRREWNEERERVRDYFFFSPRLFLGLSDSFFQEVKSNQKSFGCPIMYFILILCQSRERTYGRKRQKERERLETTQRTHTHTHTKWLRLFIFKAMPAHFLLLTACSNQILFCVM